MTFKSSPSHTCLDLNFNYLIYITVHQPRERRSFLGLLRTPTRRNESRSYQLLLILCRAFCSFQYSSFTFLFLIPSPPSPPEFRAEGAAVNSTSQMNCQTCLRFNFLKSNCLRFNFLKSNCFPDRVVLRFLLVPHYPLFSICNKVLTKNF